MTMPRWLKTFVLAAMAGLVAVGAGGRNTMESGPAESDERISEFGTGETPNSAAGPERVITASGSAEPSPADREQSGAVKSANAAVRTSPEADAAMTNAVASTSRRADAEAGSAVAVTGLKQDAALTGLKADAATAHDVTLTSQTAGSKPKGVSRSAKAKPVVYLTFDDGPSGYTEDVLDILKRERVKATFFVLGEHVERYPETVKRIAEEGHAIGNHTYNHKYEQLYGSFGEFARQVVETDKAIERAAGVKTRLLRAPGGTHRNFDEAYFRALDEAGFIVVDWNVDSGDSRRIGVPADEIVANVKASRLSERTVVLLHDSSIHQETVKALPDIIRYYRAKGYTFAALEQQASPVVFPVADSIKWKRDMPTAAETAYLQKHGASGRLAAAAPEARPANAHAAGSPTEAGGRFGAPAPAKLAGEVRKRAPFLTESRQLVVRKGGIVVRWEPGEYAIRDGAVFVPVRTLAKGFGGKVYWDGKSNKATVMVNGTVLELEPGPDSIRNNRIMLPLRGALAAFGLEIYRMKAGNAIREIEVGPFRTIA